MYIHEITNWLEEQFPAALAESWDNVGLLIGDAGRTVRRVMTCLTVTMPVVAEAMAEQVDLVVSHHPFPFSPLKRITTDNMNGRMLWELIGAKTSLYSPHTAYDSALLGINRQLADMLELQDVEPILPADCLAASPCEAPRRARRPNESQFEDSALGTGRIGHYSEPRALSAVIQQVKSKLQLAHIQYHGDPARLVRTVAIGCGAAGELVQPACHRGADVLLLGETRFHTVLEAQSLDLSLILAGHYASERFAVVHLADRLAATFPDLRCWASRNEADPIQFG